MVKEDNQGKKTNTLASLGQKKPPSISGDLGKKILMFPLKVVNAFGNTMLPSAYMFVDWVKNKKPKGIAANVGMAAKCTATAALDAAYLVGFISLAVATAGISVLPTVAVKYFMNNAVSSVYNSIKEKIAYKIDNTNSFKKEKLENKEVIKGKNIEYKPKSPDKIGTKEEKESLDIPTKKSEKNNNMPQKKEGMSIKPHNTKKEYSDKTKPLENKNEEKKPTNTKVKEQLSGPIAPKALTENRHNSNQTGSELLPHLTTEAAKPITELSANLRQSIDLLDKGLRKTKETTETNQVPTIKTEVESSGSERT